MSNSAGLYPLEDRVLVRLIDMEEKTSGGIVLARQTQDNENMADIHGYLVAGGEEGMAIMEKHGVRVGDLVVFAKYAGLVYIGEDGERYRIMNAGDVVAKSSGVFDKSLRARKSLDNQRKEA